MLIRPLQLPDKPFVHEIIKETNFFVQEEIDIALELIDDFLNNESTTYRIFVIADEQKNNQVIGYVCYGKSPASYATYDLYWIAVKPHVQKKGVGKSLINFVETEIKKENGNQILVETSSKSAYLATQKFYESLGYDKIAVIDDYYAPGDSKIIYAKKL